FIGDMYSKHGISYPSGVGVADANEIWYLEAGGGKCWAAQRVPDNAYLAVANGYRIGTIDFNDKKNFIVPVYLKKFAMEKGLWKQGTKDKEFNFAQIFGGKKQTRKDYYNARRVWRIQQLLTPTLKQDPAHFTHPVMLKPDQTITVPRLISVLRDFYSGTEFDLSKSHQRESADTTQVQREASSPMAKERVIGMFNTVHTDVIQLRSFLPPDIGAVLWAGVGSSLTTPFLPYYLGLTDIPSPYRIAGPTFDDKSAYWSFRTLTSLLECNFPFLLEKILPAWQALESSVFTLQEHVEKTAVALYEINKMKAKNFLTIYSNGLSLKALQMSKELEEKLKTLMAETSGRRPLTKGNL
ncbi:MAG: dipeptidase, partial [bacterium]|nr:dipeptidase [bacterium]